MPTEDEDGYAAMDDIAIHVLFWDYTKHEQDAVNELYYIRDFPSKPLEDVLVQLDGMAHGHYTVEQYRVGYLENDVYTLFLQAGLTALDGWETPTALLIDALAQKTQGVAERVNAVQADTRVCATVTVPMRENDVVR